MNIVTLCTGNVARSVMLGFMLTTLAEDSVDQWFIRTAGTHVTEGSAMSGRTRDALMKIEGLGDHRYGSHRSHQLTDADCEWADIILAAEADNVRFVRTTLASGADKVVQLAQFDRYASDNGTFHKQLRDAVAHEPSVDFDVVDPAGGDQATYDACARQLWDLAQAFALIVRDQRDN
jgi:protein-tyrosine-phosphatase